MAISRSKHHTKRGASCVILWYVVIYYQIKVSQETRSFDLEISPRRDFGRWITLHFIGNIHKYMLRNWFFDVNFVANLLPGYNHILSQISKFVNVLIGTAFKIIYVYLQYYLHYLILCFHDVFGTVLGRILSLWYPFPMQSLRLVYVLYR